VDEEQARAFLATCVQVQTAALQVGEFVTDSVDVRPLPVKVPVEPVGGEVEKVG
jgi:hypothetical protein